MQWRKNMFLRRISFGAISGHQWLTPVILATQEAEIRRIEVWANSLREFVSKKPITKKGLVEWLKW
jgi:hypothetical protein